LELILLQRHPVHAFQNGGIFVRQKKFYFWLPLAHPSISVQEKPCLCILHHPLQPLLQIHPSHRTACYDGPFVCFDRVQLEPLKRGVSIGLTTPADIPNPHFGTDDAYLSNIIFSHGARDVGFIFEDQEAGAH
jgi:hypothetical protein